MPAIIFLFSCYLEVKSEFVSLLSIFHIVYATEQEQISIGWLYNAVLFGGQVSI